MWDEITTGSARQEIKRNRSVASKMDYEGAKFEHLLMCGKFIGGLDPKESDEQQNRIGESFAQETRPKRIWRMIKNRSLRIVHLLGFNRSQQSVGLYAFIACRNAQKETNTISIAYLSE